MFKCYCNTPYLNIYLEIQSHSSSERCFRNRSTFDKVTAMRFRPFLNSVCCLTKHWIRFQTQSRSLSSSIISAFFPLAVSTVKSTDKQPSFSPSENAVCIDLYMRLSHRISTYRHCNTTKLRRYIGHRRLCLLRT